MKQKTKYLSKATMSIVLALVLVVSTLAVGIVATNAAYVNGKPGAEANAADVAGDKTADVEDAAVGAKAPEAVGANAGESVGSPGRYLYVGYNDDSLSKAGELPVSSYSITKNNTVYINVTRNSSSWYKDYEWYSESGAGKPNYSISGANGITYLGIQNRSKTESDITYHPYFLKFKVTATGTYDFSYDDDTDTLTITGGAEPHDITYNTPEHGSFTIAPTSANNGDTVTIEATPSTGYQVSSVTYTPSGGSATACTHTTGNKYTFPMSDKDVEVNATFSPASYAVTASYEHCTLTGTGTYAYNSSVTFTVTPQPNYALQTLTVKQGTANVQYTDNLDGTYTFTMPAGDVAINAVCANTSGTTTVYFKSATAYVYHPLISVNGGTEQKMEIAKDGNNQPIYLEKGSKDSKVKPKSDTGSLRYAWYKIELTDVDLSSPVSIVIRGQDTYMEATGTFTLTEGGSVYLACDNLMEGNTLVNLTSASDAVKDFYDTPLHMVATAAEIAAINGN